jgi:uncharacterized membrane protein
MTKRSHLIDIARRREVAARHNLDSRTLDPASKRSHRIDIARRREVAARHNLDLRTLDRAIDLGPDAIRAGMARDRARRAVAEIDATPASPTAA